MFIIYSEKYFVQTHRKYNCRCFHIEGSLPIFFKRYLYMFLLKRILYDFKLKTSMKAIKHKFKAI